MKKPVKKKAKRSPVMLYTQIDMDGWKADVKAAENAYEDMRQQRDAIAFHIKEEREKFVKETELVRQRHQHQIDRLNSELNSANAAANKYRNEVLFTEAWQENTLRALHITLQPEKHKFNV